MMTPTEQLLAALTERGCDPKQGDSGWSARCPAHDDRNPSLSVSEGDDGRVLVHCHAGCSHDLICGAVGMKLADLFPPTASTNSPPRQTRKKPPRRKQQNGKPKGESYSNVSDALAALDASMKRQVCGCRVAQWKYTNASNELVAMVVRYDLPTPEGEKQQKTFRPVSLHDDGWRLVDPPATWPLFRLPDLANAERVYICEGEKAVDAARSIGLTATTSAHGSQSPDKTDWSPLAVKECVILPDHDEPGDKYAVTVAGILATLTPPAVVKVVKLPDLPDHGDIVDWIEAHGDAADLDELRRQVEALVGQAEVVQPDRTTARISRFQPFPSDVLPEPIRGFVEGGAKAIGCDPSYIALPMLTAMAAAIGNTRRIQLKRGWSEPAILWTAIVGDSGTLKSPALELALQPLRDLQRKSLAKYTERMTEYWNDLLRYERDLAGWKKSKAGGDPPDKPDQPIADRYWCDDPTIEAVAVLLLNQWRGLVMVRDELAGWIGGFDRYSQGKGGDVARWLEMFGGRPMVVDRKTGVPPMIFVPRAAMSVTGGIQPDILRRCLGQQYRENGLAARLLLTYPPRQSKQWTEADIDPKAETAIAELFDQLYQLKPAVGADDELCPVVIGLTPDAKREWIKFYNAHAQEHAELSGDLSATWSKLEGYAARFALVIHFARWAAGDPELETTDAVDEASINAGIQLSRWFGQEARRIYAILDEGDESRERRQLVELIHRRGGKMTTRDLMRSSRHWATATDAETALQDLAKAGYGQWVVPPASTEGGRPTRVFVLNGGADVDTTPTKPCKNDSTVNVNGVNAPADDWGEL